MAIRKARELSRIFSRQGTPIYYHPPLYACSEAAPDISYPCERLVRRLPRDLQATELDSLLFRAGERYRTACATVHEVTNGTLASRTGKRSHDHAMRRGMIYYLYSREEDAEQDEAESAPPDFSWALTIEGSEKTSKIWHVKPDRWRQETRRHGDSETTCDVTDGGRRWIYDPPDQAFYSSDNYGANRSWPVLSSLLDPAYALPDHLFDCTTVRATGREATYAGRKTFEVEAKTISLDQPPHGLSGVAGADDYLTRCAGL